MQMKKKQKTIADELITEGSDNNQTKSKKVVRVVVRIR